MIVCEHKNIWGQEISLEEMLVAREQRYRKQKQLIQTWKHTIICLSMNIPGAMKATKEIEWAFEHGRNTMMEVLRKYHVEIIQESIEYKKTGYEWYVSVDEEAVKVKRYMTFIEEKDEIGRIYDIDVFNHDGDKISRMDIHMPPRKCMLCGEIAHACSRNRTHSVEELFAYIEQTIQKALMEEVDTTPKPGLVDQLDCGAHDDMDYKTFVKSSKAITPHLVKMARKGYEWKGNVGDLFP